MSTEALRRWKLSTRRLRQVLLGWAAIVALIALWQTLTYSGAVAIAAEWQFDRFGRYFPALTLIVLAALFGSPVLFLLRRRPRRHDDPGVALAIAAERQACLLLRILLWLAGGFCLAALVALALVLFLPATTGAPLRVTVGAPGSISPDEGPTRLVGAVQYDRTSAFDGNLLLFRRSFRFAPVQPIGRPSSDLRYFIELGPDEHIAPVSAERTGILRRGSLPGEIIRLYRYAGYELTKPHYVLYQSRTSMRWPYYVTAAHLAFVALVLGLASAFQYGRWRKIRRQAADREAAVPIAAPE